MVPEGLAEAQLLLLGDEAVSLSDEDRVDAGPSRSLSLLGGVGDLAHVVEV